ncbi:translation initiation factor IF-2 [Streptomyces sp. ALI-76-A]|uniref:WXG100 family type VII secretion target n=1 Tax=Streptomyces sp. ALI-76-A TaxID=3025736 RepID=UPI00256EC946|nr:translation initiation factor IF-2 [Streptomyces sp. ALI-76-A]MDL5202004.1 translation initiation factor IF-2 [Streptomyces sp. ALI-76-A]
MPAEGPGGSTPFENMSHEQMLAWLDRANAGTVQAAADRLVTAAKEIRKIAEELKVRPQWVEWKGEGADAFRTWSADLANSALRLGDFSEGAGQWLARASDAIAHAQVSIPRDAGSAQANLDAARSARNDPDAASVGAKSTSELAALAANKEAVRQQAAAQMRKLGESYSWSAMQMNSLERPKFPPPPEAIVPEKEKQIDEARSLARPGSAHQGSPSTMPQVSTRASDVAVGQTGPSSRGSDLPERPALADVTPPTRMDIDSVETLPRTSQTPAGPAVGPPAPGRVDAGVTPPTGMITPALGGRTASSAGPAVPGRATVAGRTPSLPGQGVPATNPGRASGGNGIVGGRPTTPPAGRPMGAIPRGTVVGGEATTSRGPLGPAANTAAPAGSATGRPGQSTGRALPPSNGGVVGGSRQQSGRAETRPSLPGSSGVAGNSGATVRGGVSGGAPSAGRPGASRGDSAPRTAQSASPPRTDNRSGRSRRQAGDDENRQQGGRRTVPPVVD